MSGKIDTGLAPKWEKVPFGSSNSMRLYACGVLLGSVMVDKLGGWSGFDNITHWDTGPEPLKTKEEAKQAVEDRIGEIITALSEWFPAKPPKSCGCTDAIGVDSCCGKGKLTIAREE